MTKAQLLHEYQIHTTTELYFSYKCAVLLRTPKVMTNLFFSLSTVKRIRILVEEPD